MKFHIYKDKAGEYRWRLVARNGKTVADSSEGYKRVRSCLRALDRICDELVLGVDVQLDGCHLHSIVTRD